jgi:hypothetical protein
MEEVRQWLDSLGEKYGSTYGQVFEDYGAEDLETIREHVVDEMEGGLLQSLQAVGCSVLQREIIKRGIMTLRETDDGEPAIKIEPTQVKDHPKSEASRGTSPLTSQDALFRCHKHIKGYLDGREKYSISHIIKMLVLLQQTEVTSRDLAATGIAEHMASLQTTCTVQEIKDLATVIMRQWEQKLQTKTAIVSSAKGRGVAVRGVLAASGVHWEEAIGSLSGCQPSNSKKRIASQSSRHHQRQRSKHTNINGGEKQVEATATARSPNQHAMFSGPRMVAVSQLDRDTGEVLCVHESMSIAAASVGAFYQNIAASCQGSHLSARGFRWRRATPEDMQIGPPINQLNTYGKELDATTAFEGAAWGMGCPRRVKAVVQLDMASGEVLNIHASHAAAADAVQGNRQGISNCCMGRSQSSHGFKWRHATHEETLTMITLSLESSMTQGTACPSPSCLKPSLESSMTQATACPPPSCPKRGGFLQKAVAQLDPHSGEVVCIHASQNAAARVAGVDPSVISKSCAGKIRVCCGFNWRPATPEESTVASLELNASKQRHPPRREGGTQH